MRLKDKQTVEAADVASLYKKGFVDGFIAARKAIIDACVLFDPDVFAETRTVSVKEGEKICNQ